jgi:hypothetical protein
VRQGIASTILVEDVMAHPEEKVEAAIRMLKADGHVVERKLLGEKGTWFDVDLRMRVSWEEMQNLADGVYSLIELEELFIRRRVREASEHPHILADQLLREGSDYFELGYADALPQELKDRALGYLNASENLDNQRRNIELIEQHTGQPVPDASLEPAVSREHAAREAFLDAYRSYLDQKRILMDAYRRSNEKYRELYKKLAK